jgi:hypothetical protein
MDRYRIAVAIIRDNIDTINIVKEMYGPLGRVPRPELGVTNFRRLNHVAMPPIPKIVMIPDTIVTMSLICEISMLSLVM